MRGRGTDMGKTGLSPMGLVALVKRISSVSFVRARSDFSPVVEEVDWERFQKE